MTRTARALLCALAFAASIYSGIAAAQGNDMRVETKVRPDDQASIRLLKLPRGVTLSVALEAEAPLTVALLDEAAFHAYPKIADPLFSGKLERRLSFAVTISASGTYYLVLDNRGGAQETLARVRVRATLPAGAKPAPAGPSADRPRLHQF